MRDHGEFESPVDLPVDETGGNGLLWATVAITVASLLLLVTNAFSLRGWIDEQTPGPLQARLAETAAGWEKAMASVWLDRPRAEIHHMWKAAQAARFKSEEQPLTD